MATIFLSYSHKDKVIAQRLAKDLRTAGANVWIDEVELKIADSLIQKIGPAIDKADFLAVLLSGNSVTSKWVINEVEVALTGNIPVLPLLVGDCEVPPFLRGKVYADFRDPASYQRELTKVLERVGATTVAGTAAIVFDESYRQDRWYAQPVIRAGYGVVADTVGRDYTVTANDCGYASVDALAPRGIVILPMPFGTMVDERHYDNLTKWVLRGGRLMLLGLYLMELHHYSNLNNLARRFGFDFSHDLTMPVGHEDFRECMDQAFAFANRDYWVLTKLVASPASHPIVEGISTLATTSSCTITTASTPDLLVSTADSVAVMHAQGHMNPEGRMIQLTNYVLDKHAPAPILAALRYGKGKVVGIGSWKLFVNELVEEKQNDNISLFRNLIKWLSAE